MKKILSVAVACSILSFQGAPVEATPFAAIGKLLAPSHFVAHVNHWRYRDRWCCGPVYYPGDYYAPRAYGYYYPPAAAAYYPPPVVYYPPRYYAPPIAYDAYDYGYVVSRRRYYDDW